jgi:hypothetical protein
VFDFKARSLARKTDMIRSRWTHCGYLLNKIVYVFGGLQTRTAEYYSIDDDRWTNLPPVPFTVHNPMAFTVDLWRTDLYITA